MPLNDKYAKIYKRDKNEENKNETDTKHNKPVRRALLQPENDRDEHLESLRKQQEKVKSDIQVHQTEKVINEHTSQQESAIFYCKTCKITLSDSQAWIDHINGKNHYKALGMSMVVERVSVNRVKEKLAGLKRNKPDKEK